MILFDDIEPKNSIQTSLQIQYCKITLANKDSPLLDVISYKMKMHGA